MRRRSPTFFYSDECIELMEFSRLCVHSKEIDLREEIEQLEFSKDEKEKNLVMYKPLVDEMQRSEVVSVDSLFAILRCTRAINRLEKIVEELNSKLKAKKAELARLESPSNQSQPPEPNYYGEVMMCRMQ